MSGEVWKKTSPRSTLTGEGSGLGRDSFPKRLCAMTGGGLGKGTRELFQLRAFFLAKINVKGSENVRFVCCLAKVMSPQVSHSTKSLQFYSRH